MTSLDRKLMRDLWQMKGQALAIALVVGHNALRAVVRDEARIDLNRCAERATLRDDDAVTSGIESRSVTVLASTLR